MNHKWNTYKESLCVKMPFLRRTLREGASAEDIRAAEEEIALSFPDELKDLYLSNDGDNNEALCGMILGFHFLSLDSLLSEWRSMKKIAENADINYGSRFSSTPEGCIRKCYADTKWIPICSDGGGNFIGLDLNPDVNGTVGQIINFGRDEYHKTVLAESLDAFFVRLTRILYSKDFHIGEYDGEEVIFFGPEEGAHLTDYLKSEASVK